MNVFHLAMENEEIQTHNYIWRLRDYLLSPFKRCLRAVDNYAMLCWYTTLCVDLWIFNTLCSYNHFIFPVHKFEFTRCNVLDKVLYSTVNIKVLPRWTNERFF